MSRPNPLPPQDRLRTLFSYDADTGLLMWRKRGQGRPVSGIAGTVNGGRRIVKVDGVRYFAARLIWKWVHGVDPIGEVDHKDTDSLNDRLDNLRDATQLQNTHNRGRVRSPTGFKGVTLLRDTYRSKPYLALITVEGVHNVLGYFAAPEEAAGLYDAIAAEVFGPFARTNAMIRASAVID